MRVLTLSLVLLTVSLPQYARAQQTSPGASALGVVFDSVRLRPLGGARIRVDSSTLAVTADSDGRFHIEGIPPGEHFLAVEHAMLDTLGVVLRSVKQTYVAGETKAAELATPAPETLIEMVCSPAWRARGPAALMGRVREADSGNPATGAKVSLVWYEIDITSGVRRAPRVREATVGPDGTYRICGLPAQLDGRVQVMRGPLTSGEIMITFAEDLLALRSMSIAAPSAVVETPSSPSDSSRRGAPVVRGTAQLTGKVLNKSGQPLVGARVQLDGTTRTAVTRTSGDFTLDSLPPGTQNVTVRLLGYAPLEAAVDLSSREPRSVTLRMEDFVPTLEAVRITAQRERALDDVGFSRRQRAGMGWYLDGEAIKSRNSLNFSDLMRSAPGLRITQHMGRQMIESSRDPVNGCVVVWLDGTQWQQLEPGDIDDFVKPHELAAVEVYSPSSTPAEYQSAGRSSCSTIIAWTSRRLDRRRR